MRSRLSRGRVAAIALAVLMLPLVRATASAEPGTVTLEASPTVIDHGETVGLAGVLSTAEACLEARTTALQGRPVGAEDWSQLGAAATSADGSFALEAQPEEIVDVRAVVAPEAREGIACEEVTSPIVRVRVRASVTLMASRNPIPASRCAWLRVEVRPPKPAQEVVVERHRGGAWVFEEALALTTGSTASHRLCVSWGDRGRHRFRARWAAQDDRSLAGISSARSVRVVKAPWMKEIDAIAGRLGTGVSVREAGAFVYRRSDTVARTPASNQKLLLSMALLDELGPDRRLPTRALSRRPAGGVIRGAVWIVGSGDPEVGPSKLRRLARRIEGAGVRRITGGVRGSTAFFGRDWWAPGWRSYFPRTVIPLPTALTFRGNEIRGRHVSDPERRAASTLTRQLRRIGVRVGKRAGTGRHPRDLSELTRVGSRPLSGILAITNHASSNFRAEVLTKRLGAAARRAPGTIAKGADAIVEWVHGQGASAIAYDGSGLSYANRTTPVAIARLLERVEGEPWGALLRSTLPSGGVGTLSPRLRDVPVRAKTGTLSGISALSGWVLSERTGTWVEFSILSQGVSTSAAKAAEDRIVRILWRNAR